MIVNQSVKESLYIITLDWKTYTFTINHRNKVIFATDYKRKPLVGLSGLKNK